MSSKLTVLEQQCGPKLRLTLSVLRLEYTCSEMITNTYDVNGLAQIVGKLQPDFNDKKYIILRIGMKKTDAAKNVKVSANITCKKFDKQFSCCSDWIEVVIEPKLYYDSFVEESRRIAYSYTVAVDISVHATMATMPAAPVLPVVNKLLYEDTEFTDFQLHTTDGTVAVHKAILSVHGDMFKTMLRGNWKETNEDCININGVTVETLQHLKEYMYLGTLPDEGLESLLLIAGPYLMGKLEEDCITQLVKSLKPEKFDGLIEFACLNNIPQLMKALVLSIPDSVVNSVRQLKINQQESSDK